MFGHGTSRKELLTSICGRRLSTPQDLIDLFIYETMNEHLAIMSATVPNTNDMVKLKALMEHYFNGSGHPSRDNWNLTHVDQQSRDLVADDRLMHSRCLLLMLTGSELLPSDKDTWIYVGFIQCDCPSLADSPHRCKL
jgi:hypothetical protein